MHRSIKPLYLLLAILSITVGLFTYRVLPTSQQPAAKAATLNPIQKENLLPGTTSWQLTNPTPFDATNHSYDQGIEGYASVTSVKVGGTVSFAVDSTTSSFNADIYRLGWYQGNGARLIQSLTNIAGHSYAIPSPNSQTGLVEASWPSAFSLTIPSGWVSGVYLVKLTNLNGLQSYISFVVKSTRTSDFAFIHSANTDEAYNIWGGTSLYQDLTQTLPAGRAFKVSFDRPFTENVGAGHMLNWEYPMIRWLEKNGYDTTYLTDVDVHTSSTVLLGHHGVLIVGHSEYWSGQMRDHLQTAINNGVNLGAFGANDIYWQVRYEASSSGVANRVVVCYKDASLDPLTNKNNSRVTVNFRSSPVNAPEQTTLGSMFNSFFVEDDTTTYGFPWIVKKASSWVYAGTGLRNGNMLPGLVGYEFDSLSTQYPMPATIRGADDVNRVEVLSASPVTDYYNNQATANATLYTAPSGARVFNAGTIQWSWGLDGWTLTGRPDVTNQAAQQITANILHNFITGAITPGTVVK
jgi:hypothetical protein